MAQLPKGRLVRGHDKPIHGSCAIYFPGGIIQCCFSCCEVVQTICFNQKSSFISSLNQQILNNKSHSPELLTCPKATKFRLNYVLGHVGFPIISRTRFKDIPRVPRHSQLKNALQFTHTQKKDLSVEFI